MAPEQVQTAPVGFERSTRHMQRSVEAVNYSQGGSVTRQLPPVGLLSKLYILVKVNVTATHASVTTLTGSSFGPWNLIRRLKLSVNNGFDIVNVSGYGLFLENLLSQINARLDQTGQNEVYQFEKVASSGGNSNQIYFMVEVPISLNDRDNLALFMLQNPRTVLQLTIDWADVAANTGPYTDIVQSGMTTSAISGTAQIVAEFFAVPKKTENWPDLGFLFQTLEYNQVISAVGEQTYSLPQGNTLAKIIAYHKHNAVLAPTTDVERVKLSYNQSDYPYDLPSDILRGINRKDYGRDIPQGVFALDFNHQGIPDLGTSRDYVNTEHLTDIRYMPTIASGATLGSDSALNIIVQQLTPMGD